MKALRSNLLANARGYASVTPAVDLDYRGNALTTVGRTYGGQIARVAQDHAAKGEVEVSF